VTAVSAWTTSPPATRRSTAGHAAEGVRGIHGGGLAELPDDAQAVDAAHGDLGRGAHVCADEEARAPGWS
jgi:hypothetical protein